MILKLLVIGKMIKVQTQKLKKIHLIIEAKQVK